MLCFCYSSDRIDGNTGVKDACVVSILTDEQVFNPDFSETMSRFKMEKVLYDSGMKGPLNGYTSSGRPKHYRFKTSHLRRLKTQLSPQHWEESYSIRKSPFTENELLSLVMQKDLYL